MTIVKIFSRREFDLSSLISSTLQEIFPWMRSCDCQNNDNDKNKPCDEVLGAAQLLQGLNFCFNQLS